MILEVNGLALKGRSAYSNSPVIMATTLSKEIGMLTKADSFSSAGLEAGVLVSSPKTRKKLKANPINKTEYHKSNRKKVAETVENMVT